MRIFTLGLIGLIILSGVAYSEEAGLRVPNEVAYEIVVELDTEKHFLYGEEKITFKNTAATPFDRLYLHLYPNRFTDERSVFAREMGVNNYDLWYPNYPDNGYTFVEKLTLNGQESDYFVDDTIMRIDLKEFLMPGQEVEIYLKFRVKIPNSLARFGHDKGNYYIQWWYPRMVVYDEKGWNAEPFHADGEVYGDFAQYRVHIKVPDEMVVAATGVLQNELNNTDGTKTLTYFAQDVHDFAWVADSSYKVETVTWEGITIRSLYLPGEEDSGRKTAQYARDAIEYFSRRFGKYPYPNFTVVGIRALGFAMEYPQLIMISDALYKTSIFNVDILSVLDVVTAHMVAHQWWYGIIGNNELDEAWLDEGFATYSYINYAEMKYGKRNNLYRYEELGYFWRILAYWNWGNWRNEGEKGYFDQWSNGPGKGYFDLAREGGEEILVIPRHKVPAGKFSLVYDKGFLTLTALESQVGTETFDKIMQRYFQRYKFKNATSGDFVAIAEEVSARDLDEFFDQMLYSTKKLDYVLEDVTSGKVGKYLTRASIRQDGEMQMAVDVEATTESGGKIVQRWEGKDKRGTVTFITDEPVRSVVIDPNNRLPDLDRVNNRSTAKIEIKPFFDAPYNDAYLITYSPIVGHGSLTGFERDGFIGGLDLKFSRFDEHNINVNGAYATGSGKILYGFGYDTPLWFTGNKSSRFGFGYSDNGHIRSANIGANFDLSSPVSVLTSLTHGFEVRPMYEDLYDAADKQNPVEERGSISSLNLAYRLRLNNKEGNNLFNQIAYKGSYQEVGSDFPFDKYSVDIRGYNRVFWQTSLNSRLYTGWGSGRIPSADKFDIIRDGGFRAFKRRGDIMSVLNLDLRFPLPYLNKVDLLFYPLSIGGIIFADVGRFWQHEEIREISKVTSEGLRADAGLGFEVGVHGSRNLLRFEFPLLVNTDKDEGGVGFHLGVGASF